MCPKKYRVFIGPYVDGPAAPVGSARQPRQEGFNIVREIVRQTFHDLRPSAQRRQSRPLLCLEMLAVAVLLASVVASFSGAGGAAVGVLIALVALLAAAAFVCGLIAAAGRRRYDQRVIRATNDSDLLAFRLVDYHAPGYAGPTRKGCRSVASQPRLGECWRMEALAPECLQAGDVILIESGQVIPADGTILEGAATVDESVVTGQSAPVIREHGYVEHVMRGTSVIDGRIVVEVAVKRGHPLDWSTTPAQTSVRAR